MTNTATLVGGPYDGSGFTFADRLPEGINLAIDCVDADAADPRFRAALRANLSPAERDGLVVIRDAQSLLATYQLELDVDGAPWYRYVGPSVQGGRNEQHP
jgi:hypothetical protein